MTEGERANAERSRRAEVLIIMIAMMEKTFGTTTTNSETD